MKRYIQTSQSSRIYLENYAIFEFLIILFSQSYFPKPAFIYIQMKYPSSTPLPSPNLLLHRLPTKWNTSDIILPWSEPLPNLIHRGIQKGNHPQITSKGEAKSRILPKARHWTKLRIKASQTLYKDLVISHKSYAPIDGKTSRCPKTASVKKHLLHRTRTISFRNQANSLVGSQTCDP